MGGSFANQFHIAHSRVIPHGLRCKIRAADTGSKAQYTLAKPDHVLKIAAPFTFHRPLDMDSIPLDVRA